MEDIFPFFLELRMLKTSEVSAEELAGSTLHLSLQHHAHSQKYTHAHTTKSLSSADVHNLHAAKLRGCPTGTMKAQERFHRATLTSYFRQL